MTLKNLSRIAVVVSALAAVAGCVIEMQGCTSNEQQEQIDRQKLVEEREAKDKAEAEAKATPQPEATPEQTPEAPAEPEKVVTYHFVSNSERMTINCQVDGDLHECGESFTQCGDGSDEYHCQTGVHSWTTEK